MNDRPEPLASDVVDELLSAQLDGEFDAAAADAGMQPEEARARLAVTPGVAERARALEAARAELSDVPPLDSFTRRRLVTRALPVEYRDDRRRVGQWLVGAAGVAAAIAIVFALLAHPGRDGGDGAASRAASPTAERTEDRATVTPRTTSGTIDDERALQQYVAAVRAGTDDFTAAAPTQRGASSGNASSDDTSQEFSRKPAEAALADAPRCNETIADELDLAGARLVHTGAVTHDGKPAIVTIYTRDGDVLGFLYDPLTCKVVISTFSK